MEAINGDQRKRLPSQLFDVVFIKNSRHAHSFLKVSSECCWLCHMLNEPFSCDNLNSGGRSSYFEISKRETNECGRGDETYERVSALEKAE